MVVIDICRDIKELEMQGKVCSATLSRVEYLVAHVLSGTKIAVQIGDRLGIHASRV